MSRVLIAEDEPAVLEIVAEVLEGVGYEVVRAQDGAHALELARENPPDVILSDYMMPRLSGDGLCLAVHADPALQHIPVVLMSAVRPPITCAAAAFLRKPFELEEIEHVLAQVLAQRAVPVRQPPITEAPGAIHDPGLTWVSHAIKTPLSVAKTHLQLLEREASVGPGRGRDHVRAAVRQIDKVTSLIESFLDSARLAGGRVSLNPERVEVTSLVREVVHEWTESEARSSIRVVTVDEPVHAQLDRVRVRQILDNLLANAILHGASQQIEVTVHGHAGDHVKIDVIDHGPGIAASELPHLFEPFRIAGKGHKNGHGLGLHIAAELARLHGGELSAQSAAGAGATFSLRLPAAPRADAPARSENSHAD